MSINNSFYLKDVWTKTLSSLQESLQLDSLVLDQFYSTSSLSNLNDEKAIITVPNVITKSILIGEIEAITSSLEKTLNASSLLCEIMTFDEFEQIQAAPPTTEAFQETTFLGSPLFEDRTFDNFIVGDSNRESHSAALGCAYSLGKLFNPLFIYGNSGLGKSHLLNAIGNYVIKNDSTKRVYYIDSSKFVDNVVNSIRTNKIDAFKKFMFSIDVLLIDDIQFLAGKEKSHEIFFSIFNELVNNRKQICIVSDRLPTEIKGLEERLISRFSSGLSVGIDSPEFETSLAILQMKIRNNSSFNERSIDDDSLAFIASNFNRDVRQLEGALNRVLFYSILNNVNQPRITLKVASDALKGQTVTSDSTGISSRKIIKCVAEYYGLTKQQLTSKSRTKNISVARQISIFLCRKLLDLPYAKIGEEFGGRDHSTIMSSCEKVEKLMKKTPSYAQAVIEIEKIIKT
ncbi:MAG: chromosomal replication initiator protein DnaA [Anaerorhabdus sp.]